MKWELIFSSLKEAVSSRLAITGYLIALCAWVFGYWLSGRPERVALQIIKTLKTDKEKNRALSKLLGENIPEGLEQKDMLEYARERSRARTKVLYFSAYCATLLAVLIVIGVALHDWNRLSSSESPPVLIDSYSTGGGK